MSYDGTYPAGAGHMFIPDEHTGPVKGPNVIDMATNHLDYYETQVRELAMKQETLQLQLQEVQNLLAVSRGMVKSMRNVLGRDQDAPVTAEGRY